MPQELSPASWDSSDIYTHISVSTHTGKSIQRPRVRIKPQGSDGDAPMEMRRRREKCFATRIAEDAKDRRKFSAIVTLAKLLGMRRSAAPTNVENPSRMLPMGKVQRGEGCRRRRYWVVPFGTLPANDGKSENGSPVEPFHRNYPKIAITPFSPVCSQIMRLAGQGIRNTRVFPMRKDQQMFRRDAAAQGSI